MRTDTVATFILKKEIPENKVLIGDPFSDELYTLRNAGALRNAKVESCSLVEGVYLIEVFPR